jgi:FO synthase subunit 2
MLSARLERSLADAEPGARAILEACLGGRELDVAGALALSTATGPTLQAMCSVADQLRHEQVGDTVTYVVNRNINFTNVCIKSCRFCAFSRTQRSEEAYFLSADEVVRRAVEARDLGATEVCIQAGLAPGMDGRSYVELCRAVKRAAPELHIHAFSPEEIKYGAKLAGVPVRSFLEELKDAGLGSLPGTSAEVLDDEVRKAIAPGRISTAEWIEVIETAHAIGLPTTSTLMYGHIETDLQRVEHMALIRSIQKATGGFTEFVPLSFVAQEAPMFKRSLVRGVRGGPTRDDVLRLHALARLLLGACVPNLQVSWVKEGLDRAAELLDCGANDLGGTLINESISTAAGASHGQLASPATLREVIRRAGREPVQRDTRYRVLRRYSIDGHADDERGPLDDVGPEDERFGSYAALTRDARFRFERPARPR